MNLTKTERKRRAIVFIKRFTDAVSEEGEKQTFYNEFFDIFGKDRKAVAMFEKAVKRLPGTPPGKIDLLWPRVLLVEHKSVGKNLDSADDQADEYYMSLDSGISPRYILTSDFKNFRLRDLEEGKLHKFELENLHDNLELFGFMVGEKSSKEEEKVSVKASALMDDVYESMLKTKYNKKHIGQYLTRLAYCMFAEDAEVFGHRGMFVDYITNKTATDGTDLGIKLHALFNVLNTESSKRQSSLDPDLNCFPYINGGLFDDVLDMCSFTKDARMKIINAAKFNWRFASPAIFGSMFEGIIDNKKRRESGSHYTSTDNVLKLIKPLFLDELYEEFDNILESPGNTEKKLENFQDRLAKLKFFDPACGSGSFLITTYSELRKLEFDIIRLIDQNKRIAESSVLSKINVDQFYGIELQEFPARITETAMWMVDHIMNMELSDRYDGKHTRIPLKKHPNIKKGDSLEIDWIDVLPPDECNYILGNPPFVGAFNMTDKQKAQTTKITGNTRLDFVANWFIKASKYANEKTRIGFVATNSITQGEQVGYLWPQLQKKEFEIIFAHKSFLWESDIMHKASVIVVIIGFSRTGVKVKSLFSDKEKSTHRYISPYLIGSNTKLPIISRSSKIKNNLPQIMTEASRITDGGHYIFTEEEYEEFISLEPAASDYFRRYLNAKALMSNEIFYVFDFSNMEPDILAKLPLTSKRVDKVRKFRKSCKSPKALASAETPLEYERRYQFTDQYLAMPRVSSSRREYYTVTHVEPSFLPTNTLVVCKDGNLSLVGLLSSKMHMAWMKITAGRLKNDYRYSSTPYKTFPIPTQDLSSLEKFTQAILDARKNHPNSTLAQLYDPELMPTDLKTAHIALDRAIDKLYRDEPFTDDDERIKFLLERYGEMMTDGQKKLKISKPKKIKTPKATKPKSETPKPTSAGIMEYSSD